MQKKALEMNAWRQVVQWSFQETAGMMVKREVREVITSFQGLAQEPGKVTSKEGTGVVDQAGDRGTSSLGGSRQGLNPS